MQVDHQQCPYCRHKDCYSYNTELNVYRCFSCGKSGVLTPTLSNGNYEEGEDQLSDAYVPESYRGIKKAILENYGVWFTDNTVHFSYPNGTKHRELPKTIRISGRMDHFFLSDFWNSGERDTITITEGEEDALSVLQMMGDYPVVSVPGATPSRDFWTNAREYLSGFQKIKLSVDNDEAGNALAQKFYNMFPGKCHRVNHTLHKDANAFLQEGDVREYKSSWWNSSLIKPDTILCTKEDFTRLYDETPDYDYYPTGVKPLDDKILGIHKGYFTVILAPTGIGKTQFMRYLEHQAIVSGKRIAVCHLEETKLTSLLGLVSYGLGDNLSRKDLIEDKGREQDVKEELERLAETEQVYQFSLPTNATYEDLISQIRYLSEGIGVDYVFFEPMQDVIMGNVADKESQLTDLTNQLKRLAPELNVGIVTIAHANEDGDAKYCKSIVQGAGFEIVLDRDIDAENEEVRNTMQIRVGRKNRTGGGSGPAGELVFDTSTYMLTNYQTPTVGNDSEIGF